MAELPLELINRVKISTRKAAGLSNYNPSDPSLPALPSLSAAIALSDPTEPHLRCKNCKGRLLRGPQSAICLYCGSAPLYDEVPEPINFTSTIGYQWLLQSLHLKGSELVMPRNKYDQDQGRSIPKVLTPLSDFLNLQIPWSGARNTQGSSFPDKHETEHKRPWNSNGVPPDKFFLNTQKNDSSDRSFKEAILDDFESFGEDFGSFRTQKTSQSMQSYEPAVSSSMQKTGQASVEWAAEFQSAYSENKHGGDISSDHFLTASDEFGDRFHKSGSFTQSKDLEIVLATHIDSVLGLGKDLNDRKPSDSAEVSTAFDDWNSDDMWKNLSSNAHKSGDRLDSIVRTSDDPKDDNASGNWKDSSASADLFQHLQSESEATDRNDYRTQHKEHDETVDDNITEDWNDFTRSTSLQAPPRNAWSGTDFEVPTSQNFQPQAMDRNDYRTQHKEHDETLDDNTTDDWNDFTRSTSLRAPPHNGWSGTDFQVPTSENFQPQTTDKNGNQTQHKEHDETVDDNTTDDWNDFTRSTNLQAPPHNAWSGTEFQVPTSQIFQPHTTDKNGYQDQHKEHDETMDDDTIDEWNDFAGSTSAQAPPYSAWTGTDFQIPISENFQTQTTDKNGSQTQHKEHDETIGDGTVDEWNDFAGSSNLQAPPHSTWSGTDLQIPISEKFQPQPTNKNDYRTQHKEHHETMDDDTIDEWNDFTGLSSVQVPPHSAWSGTDLQIPTSEKKSLEMDLFGFHNKSEVSSGGLSEPILFPTAIRVISTTEEVNYAVSSNQAAKWFDDAGSPSHESGQSPNSANAVPQSAKEEVMKLISQMHDLSFMLEADLSVPSHSPTPKD